MKKKKCFKCGKIKVLSDFYKHPMMEDGHVNKCKDCNKNDVKIRYQVLIKNPEWKEKERARGREKAHRLGYTGFANRKRSLRHIEKYPEKRKAVISSQNIEPAFEGAHKHHWSYNEEHFKDVFHLTQRNHAKAHRFLIYDQERKMYRTLSGELLDTRERHESYILEMINTKPD